MRFSTLGAVLLFPLLAVADDASSSLTTTITSTATLTKTITVSEVIASVTSTYANSTVAAATTTAKTSSLAAATTSKTIPANYMGAAPSLNGMYAGSAGVLVMIAAALL